MAIVQGHYGKYTQSTAGITFSNWKGRNVMKSKVPSTNTSNTPAQQQQREAFREMARFAKILAPMIQIGYNDAATTTTQQNVFISKNFKNGAYNPTVGLPNIFYTEVSAGTVGLVSNLALSPNPPAGKAVVSWANNSDGVSALPTDELYLFAIMDDSGYPTYFGKVGTRAGGSPVQLAAPGDGDGRTLCLWAFFKRANSTACSNTARLMNF